MLPELLDFSKVAQNCARRSKIKMPQPILPLLLLVN